MATTDLSEEDLSAPEEEEDLGPNIGVSLQCIYIHSSFGKNATKVMKLFEVFLYVSGNCYRDSFCKKGHKFLKVTFIPKSSTSKTNDKLKRVFPS